MSLGAPQGTIIAVTSGKGGVGKTSISANLALALCKQGKRVVLFDADLALANAHIVMGVIPEHTVADALRSDLPLMDIAAEGPGGVKLISAGNGVDDMLNLASQHRHTIIKRFSELASATDYIVVDTAAGIDENVTDFVEACSRVIVVVVGEPSAFIDAYACVKVLSQAGRITHFDIVVNRARSAAHGVDVFNRFKGIVDRFLTANIYHAATIPEDDQINGGSNCEPAVLSAPLSRSARAIESLARDLTGPMARPVNSDDALFFAVEPAVQDGARL